jgi:hypothetical protein
MVLVLNELDMTLADRAIEIVEEYIEPGSHYIAMERVHRNTFDEDVSFDGFDEAKQEYRRKDWDLNTLRDFAAEARQVVEGGDGYISETYFDILKPETPSKEYIREEFDNIPYQADEKSEDRAGFQYEELEDEIDGRYVYVDIDTNISYSGRVNRLVDEGSLEFRILPEEKILILQSTSVIDVQKTKSIISKKTNLEIGVSGDLTALDHDLAASRIDDFRDSFLSEEEAGDVAEDPVLIRVDDLEIHRPEIEAENGGEDEEILTGIDFEGIAIADHPEVRARIDEGWMIKKLECRVRYKEALFNVTVAGTSVMGYAKISNFTSRPKARELMTDIREKFQENLT